MKITEETTIGEYVAHDFRTAAIFSKYGIDFCCKGNRTIKEACETKRIDSEAVQHEVIAILESKSEGNIDYLAWPLDLLADYIEKKHHRYVEEKIPHLLTFLNKLQQVHGANHPELLEINNLFIDCSHELTKHLKKEELVLFPFIRKMTQSVINQQPFALPQHGSVEEIVTVMRHEHDTEGERFRKIAALSNDYTPPSDACNTYKVTFAMLREFEQDLHQHIHLENNILFPKAQKMALKLFTIAE
jgi:regulator of cell morphogenesis and NO signaling